MLWSLVHYFLCVSAKFQPISASFSSHLVWVEPHVLILFQVTIPLKGLVGYREISGKQSRFCGGPVNSLWSNTSSGVAAQKYFNFKSVDSGALFTLALGNLPLATIRTCRLNELNPKGLSWRPHSVQFWWTCDLPPPSWPSWSGSEAKKIRRGAGVSLCYFQTFLCLRESSVVRTGSCILLNPDETSTARVHSLFSLRLANSFWQLHTSLNVQSDYCALIDPPKFVHHSLSWPTTWTDFQ